MGGKGGRSFRSHCLLATAPDRTVSGPWRTPVTSTLTASTVLRGLSPARTILFLMMRLGSVNTLMVPTEKVALPSNCTEFSAPTMLFANLFTKETEADLFEEGDDEESFLMERANSLSSLLPCLAILTIGAVAVAGSGRRFQFGI